MSDGELEILDDLVEDYLARHRRGEHPDPDEFCRRFPHLADEIHEVFPTALLMERVRKSGQWRVGDLILRRDSAGPTRTPDAPK